LAGAARSARRACAGLLAGAALHAAALAHGNVSIEEDPCAHLIRGYWIHYSAYQPRFDQRAHYCQEIPSAGETVLVVDIADKVLRERPISLQVDGPGRNGTIETLFKMPAQPYPTGVINAEVVFERPGRYTVLLLSPQAERLDRLELLVQVVNWPKLISRWSTIAVAVALLIWLGMRVRRYFARARPGASGSTAQR
jgi:hypothetical protein